MRGQVSTLIPELLNWQFSFDHRYIMRSSAFLLLQHDDFTSNYVGSFKELRSAGELFDVTLACEDETIEAHKVILSACSPFFRHVFRKTKQNHPFFKWTLLSTMCWAQTISFHMASFLLNTLL